MNSGGPGAPHARREVPLSAMIALSISRRYRARSPRPLSGPRARARAMLPRGAGPRIAGTPYRLIADATLASRIGRPSPPGAPTRGRDARSFQSRRDPDTRYRSRSRIRDAPVDPEARGLISSPGHFQAGRERLLEAPPPPPLEDLQPSQSKWQMSRKGRRKTQTLRPANSPTVPRRVELSTRGAF